MHFHGPEEKFPEKPCAMDIVDTLCTSEIAQVILTMRSPTRPFTTEGEQNPNVSRGGAFGKAEATLARTRQA